MSNFVSPPESPLVQLAGGFSRFTMNNTYASRQLPAVGFLILMFVVRTHAQALGEQGKLDIIKFEWNIASDASSINPISFLQDSRGMMWVATSTGFGSFDGYSFQMYAPPEYPLSATRVIRLAEDMNGNIWIAGVINSKITIDVMNPVTRVIMPLHKFLGLQEPVEIPMHEEILLLTNINGKIWVGTPDIAYLYDGNWQLAYKRQSPFRPVMRWFPAKDGFWNIAHRAGRVYLEDNNGQILDSMAIGKYFWVDDQLNLWSVMPLNEHLYGQFIAEKGKIQVYQTASLPAFNWISESLCPTELHPPIRYGYSWENRNPDLIFARSNGTGAINLTNQFPETWASKTYYFDREGGIWTPSLNKILRLKENRPSGFHIILRDEKSNRSVRGITRIGNRLYVNTYRGDFRIDENGYRYSSFDILKGQGLCLMAENDEFWAGGHSGSVVRIRPGAKTIHYSFERQSAVYCFLRGSEGVLAGTSNGLFRINELSHSLEPTPLQNIGIYYLYKNRRGIWACTTNGLYLLNDLGQIMSHFLAPGSDLHYEQIEHLFEDKNGYFWLATKGGGLIQWSPDSGDIRRFTTMEGLSNNDIHAVYEDNQGYLWLPSNYGLMRMHKATGRIQVFFAHDGLADNEFNTLSHFKSTDGRLYFGGINGITAFHPDSIRIPEEHVQPLRIMEARTFQIQKGEFVNHLPNLESGQPILFTPDDDYLEIGISPLIYENANQIRYSWKIDGYSDKWIQQQTPVIRLHSLPYGNFTVRVRYSTQGNIWSQNELAIPVAVTKPFLLRWPFITFVILSMLGTIWLILRWRTRQLRVANQTLELEVFKRTQQIAHDKELIEQQTRELRSLDEVKSRFFANVTHELRTPLTLILGPAESLLSPDISRDKAKEYILTIQRSAARLLKLVEELLDLSKMEANKLVLIETPTHLYKFIARLMASFAPYSEHRGVDLKLIYNCPNDIALLMDTPKWEKVLNNLLNNALKFTPRGGTVTITTDIVNNKLLISVEDTGSGIHPDDQPFIFDRYYQSHASAYPMQGGAGIGLSLCKEYVKLFGGVISVQSEVGKGSIFTIICPLKITSAAESNLADMHTTFKGIFEATSTPSLHNPGKRTLLLVEDDKDMADYTQSILSPEYNLLTAENGKIALQILEKKSVDLVLSDVMMPEMDGFQLLQTIRERALDMPFIMLSARADAPDRLNALTLGVDDYLTKPFLESELTARLKNLIVRYDARKSMKSNADVPDHEKSFDQKWLKQLEQLVSENISNADFSLDDLANGLNMSRRNMYNKLVACTGMAPNQYLIEVRLNKARQLIESKSYSTLNEVCYAVGFKTPHYFRKLMKERFGTA